MDYLKSEGFCFIGFSHKMRHGWISVMYLQVNSEQLVIFTKKKPTIFSDDENHECLKAVVPFLGGKWWWWVHFFMSLSDYLLHRAQTKSNFKCIFCLFVCLFVTLPWEI